MKTRTLTPFIAGIATLLVLSTAPALSADDNHPCSTHAVAGTWGFSLTGQLDGTPTLAAGQFTLDRYGNVDGAGTFNVGGDVTDVPFSGTYTVNADCSGHMSLPDTPIEYDMVVLAGSNEILFVSRDTSLVFAADAKRLPGSGD